MGYVEAEAQAWANVVEAMQDARVMLYTGHNQPKGA